jgi:hypothetical protein
MRRAATLALTTLRRVDVFEDAGMVAGVGEKVVLVDRSNLCMCTFVVWLVRFLWGEPFATSHVDCMVMRKHLYILFATK